MNDAIHPRLVRTAACALVYALVAACHRDSPEEHLARGKDAAAKQNHAVAIIEFKNVLQSNANSGEARLSLGRELLAQGDTKNAAIELQKAYDLGYDPDAVVPLLVKSLLALGETDKVSQLIEKGGLKSPAANAALQTLYGNTLMQNRPDEALAAFAAAQKFVPGYPEALLGEARIKASRGDLAGANDQVASVLEKEPAQAEALVLKGDLARSKGATDDAIAAYEAAIKQNPRILPARLNLAGAYIGKGKLDLAQQQVDEIKKLSPKNPGAFYMDALIAFTRKDLTRANDSIAVALAGAPKSGISQLLAGAISSALNQPAQAETHLREALKAMPGNVYGRKLLASLYLRQRQPQKAEEVLAPALEKAPDDPAIVSLAGELALLKGDFANASKYFDKAARINPADVNARTQGAAVEFARGDEAGGFAGLEAASKMAVNNPNPDIALILAHLQRKQYDQAAAAWKTLEKRQPQNPLTYNLRAAIDAGRGDAAATRKDLEHALELQPDYFPALANLASMDERAKDFDSVRKRYRAVLAKEPGNLSVSLALARFEDAHGGDASVVVPLLKEARRVNPASEQPSLALAAYYESKNNRKDALSTIQDALAQSPNSPALLNYDGQLLLRSGSNDQAVAAFRKLVTINPESADAQVMLGVAQLSAGQTNDATQTFTTGLKSQPTAYRAQATAIEALLRANQGDAAARLLADVRQRSPKSPFLPELEGDVKVSQKQYDDATAIYRKLLAQQAPNAAPGLAMKTYGTLFLGGKVGEANAFIADWIKGHPKDLALRRFDADLALRAKEYPRAAQDYRVMLDVNPNDAVAMNNLAWVLWQQKDPQALALAEKASAAAPGSAAIADTLGWMLVEKGETKRGLEILEKASAKAPAQRDIALHLAKAQIKDGRRDAARTTLQNVIDAAPDSAEAKESETILATL